MVAALAAFFMFTVMNVFAKLLSANHSVVEIAFYRKLIASVPFLVKAPVQHFAECAMCRVPHCSSVTGSRQFVAVRRL